MKSTFILAIVAFALVDSLNPIHLQPYFPGMPLMGNAAGLFPFGTLIAMLSSDEIKPINDLLLDLNSLLLWQQRLLYGAEDEERQRGYTDKKQFKPAFRGKKTQQGLESALNSFAKDAESTLEDDLAQDNRDIFQIVSIRIDPKVLEEEGLHPLRSGDEDPQAEISLPDDDVGSGIKNYLLPEIIAKRRKFERLEEDYTLDEKLAKLPEELRKRLISRKENARKGGKDLEVQKNMMDVKQIQNIDSVAEDSQEPPLVGTSAQRQLQTLKVNLGGGKSIEVPLVLNQSSLTQKSSSGLELTRLNSWTGEIPVAELVKDGKIPTSIKILTENKLVLAIPVKESEEGASYRKAGYRLYKLYRLANLKGTDE